MKFGHSKLATLRYHTVKTRSLYVPRLKSVTGHNIRTDGRTDRQQNYDS